MYVSIFLVYIVGSTCKFSLVRDLSKYICTKLTGCTKEVSNAVVICVRFRVVFLFFLSFSFSSWSKFQSGFYLITWCGSVMERLWLEVLGSPQTPYVQFSNFSSFQTRSIQVQEDLEQPVSLPSSPCASCELPIHEHSLLQTSC